MLDMTPVADCLRSATDAVLQAESDHRPAERRHLVDQARRRLRDVLEIAGSLYKQPHSHEETARLLEFEIRALDLFSRLMDCSIQDRDAYLSGWRHRHA